jgi:DNA-binding GntR family transcriptional regulator
VPGRPVHDDGDMEPIDQYGETPLYVQLADLLRTDIQSGKLGPGDKLPSEKALQQLHEVSRGTVRAAVRLLVEEGLAITRAGRGTFVPPRGG